MRTEISTLLPSEIKCARREFRASRRVWRLSPPLTPVTGPGAVIIAIAAAPGSNELSFPVPRHRDSRRRRSGSHRAGRLSANALDVARRSCARHGAFSHRKAFARDRQQRNADRTRRRRCLFQRREYRIGASHQPDYRARAAKSSSPPPIPEKIFTLGPGSEPNGSFESDAFDAKIFSRWGRLTWWGDNGAAQGKVAFYVRSGNTSSPGR